MLVFLILPIDNHSDNCYILDMAEYPTHPQEPIIISAPKKFKKEADIEFYVDIENTLIDSLSNAEYMHHNCANISEYIHRHDAHHYHVHIFTCGWVYRSEIELGLVDNLYKKLNIDKAHRGSIFVKEDLVNALCAAVPDMPYDRAKLLNPGGLADVGLTKPATWEFMARTDNGQINVLIDDLVSEYDIDLAQFKFINPKNFKVVIRNYLEKPATLYTPDGMKVGQIENDTAFCDVRRQIAVQQLHGYYIKDGDGVRHDINCHGSVENPNTVFNEFIEANKDIMKAGSPTLAPVIYDKFKDIYPQPITPTETENE